MPNSENSASKAFPFPLPTHLPRLRRAETLPLSCQFRAARIRLLKPNFLLLLVGKAWLRADLEAVFHDGGMESSKVSLCRGVLVRMNTYLDPCLRAVQESEGFLRPHTPHLRQMSKKEGNGQMCLSGGTDDTACPRRKNSFRTTQYWHATYAFYRLKRFSCFFDSVQRQLS